MLNYQRVVFFHILHISPQFRPIVRFFNAFDAQRILSIPLMRAMEFVKLFDPVSFAKVNVTKAPSDYEKVSCLERIASSAPFI